MCIVRILATRRTNGYIVSNLFLDLHTLTELSEITFCWYNNNEIIYKEYLTTA